MEKIDLDVNPENIGMICDGSFMSFICPGCGKKHKPEFPVILLWPSQKLKFEVLPELSRGEFYRRKKENTGFETIISYAELADRVAVIRDGLEPVVIEALKYYLLLKAEETYPGLDISAWYHGNSLEDIEFHLQGIKADEVAVMRVPRNLYDKTLEEFRRHPKKEIYVSLRKMSYLSVQNMFSRP
jgi:hypothetical protein